MKRTHILVAVTLSLLGLFSCIEREDIPINFKDIEKYTIFEFIEMADPDSFSYFKQILEKTGLDKTLSAYNPNGDGYTLFLPHNNAIKAFVDASPDYETVDDLLNDTEFLWYFGRYHVVNMGIDANDFPFGALPEFTLTEDYLAVSFIIETDTAYYKINNQAPVERRNIKKSNGFIHIISMALTPVTQTTYGWLTEHEGFSIFKQAVDVTGLDSVLSRNPKIDLDLLPVTLFMEPDSIFNRRGINSFDDLVNRVSPDNNDYGSIYNPLYNFVAYHILPENRFLDDFMELNSNYPTFSDIPLNIDGMGIDIKINKGKTMFDTLVSGGDSIFINYVGMLYDQSNVLTQSGVIHFIDRVLEQVSPSKAEQTYEVFDRPLFYQYNTKPGEYLVMDSSSLNNIAYSGTDLIYIKLDAAEAPDNLWSDDYVTVEGDFIISFKIPKIVQGTYDVFMQADTYNSNGPAIDIYIDGKLIKGGLDIPNADIGNVATGDSPFREFLIGEINLVRYDEHTITIRSLIPGNFRWDYIQFAIPE
jgi:uncharacterized surface protein with fasciclin (FAS1) repeats